MIQRQMAGEITSYQRDDAWYCIAHFRSLGLDVEGIAIPLTPQPDRFVVYINEDWLPALFWRKRICRWDVINDDWACYKSHADNLTLLEPTTFFVNRHRYYGHGRDNQIRMATHRETPRRYGMYYTGSETELERTHHGWRFYGWWVKDAALPTVFNTQPDGCPPLFHYRDCTPIDTPKDAAKRMKLLLPLWRDYFEIAGMNFKQKHPRASADDIEIAASEYCEGFIYRDWLNQRVQPTQKATTLLYAFFCGAAGLLV